MHTITAADKLFNDEDNKKRILNNFQYNQICNYIKNYWGLAIECEKDLIEYFPKIEVETLKAILQIQLMDRMRSEHWSYDKNAKKYLEMYERRSEMTPNNEFILLDIARDERLGPVMLCRSILKIKYQNITKRQLKDFIDEPQLIKDYLLSVNVAQCLCNDIQNGPEIDLKNRLLGEEYELKMQQMADAAGMQYYKEKDLRRLGYDLTPDIKLIKPFLYKGTRITWIESKASFGDINWHKMNIKKQLSRYCECFGAGIVIYWFGYHKIAAKLPENYDDIIVLDDFPKLEDIKLLNA